jgi:transglutaminase-like putative cysteine protease
MSSSHRLSPAEQLPMALAAAGTTWAATLAWRGFTEVSARYLAPLLFLALVVAGAGLALRAARLGPALVLLGQSLLSGMVLSLMLCSSPLPVGSAWDRLVANLADSAAAAQQYAAPVPATSHGVHALLILGGWGSLVFVDFLACTLRRVPLAGLPLLMVYSLPVGLIGAGIGWFGFALSAAGFLTMLFLHQQDRVTRWGRTVGDGLDTQAFGVSTGAIKATAGSMGAAATALALFVPLLLPSLGLTIFGFGPGQGSGGDAITVENPMTDLHRDLQRGQNQPLLRIQTTDPDPSYLRIASLVNFSNEEWSTGDRSVPSVQRASGQLPALVGVGAAVPRQTYPYTVTVLPAFRSLWLPTQPMLETIHAAGDWRYDRTTMDFLASTPTLNAAGARYDFRAVKLDYDPAAMAAAPAGGSQVGRKFLELPSDFPPVVRNLAQQVTRNAPTRYEKAVALQRWFREDGGFEYTLDTPAGSGTDDLVGFLSDTGDGRRGYCEQFASSMAAMLRTLGIPARVSVGFLDAHKIAQDTYELGSDDLHAWPEAFFPGSGWVKFEPTPADRAHSVPSYTTANIPQAPETSSAPGEQKSNDVAPRGASDSAEPSARATKDRSQHAGAAGRSSGWWFGGGAALLVLAILAVTPRWLRRRRADRRLAAGLEPAWNEIRDTALDLGLGWPFGRSPREIGHEMGRCFGSTSHPATERPARGADQAPEARRALDRLVDRLERLRYARPGQSVEDRDVRAEARLVIEALRAGATGAARRRAEWWPVSLWRRTPSSAGHDDAASDLLEGSLDRVGPSGGDRVGPSGREPASVR